MAKIFFQITACIAFVLLAGCGGDKPTPGDIVPTTLPEAVTKLQPVNNSACVYGTDVSNSTVSLSLTWLKSASADSYVVIAKNLITQEQVSATTTTLQHKFVLNKNTPYSWTVTAVNSLGETPGDYWKFYVAGEATSNYLPFPAELLEPEAGKVFDANGAETMSVNFSWKCEDVDNDIANYTLYLDESAATTAVAEGITATAVTREVASGKTYFWKIVTTDRANNRSSSVVRSFHVKK